MPGGQKGLSFVGEPMVFAVIATLIICVLLGIVGCDDIVPTAGDTPMDDYDRQCEQAYADANDGDPDTGENPGILEQVDCRMHMDAVKATRAADAARQVQEAQSP